MALLPSISLEAFLYAAHTDNVKTVQRYMTESIFEDPDFKPSEEAVFTHAWLIKVKTLRSAVVLALEAGHIEIVECIFRAILNDMSTKDMYCGWNWFRNFVEEVDEHGHSCIHLALHLPDDRDVIRILHCFIASWGNGVHGEHKVFNMTIAENGDTPLIYAAKNGRTELVRFLLGRFVYLWHTNNARQTALHCAVLGGHLEIVKAILARRVPEKSLVYGDDYSGLGNGNDVEIINRGCDKDCTFKWGDVNKPCSSPSVFMCAVQKGDLDIARCLFEAGATIWSKYHAGDDVFYGTCILGHAHLVEFMHTKASRYLSREPYVLRAIRHHNVACLAECIRLNMRLPGLKELLEVIPPDNNGFYSPAQEQMWILLLGCIWLSGAALLNGPDLTFDLPLPLLQLIPRYYHKYTHFDWSIIFTWSILRNNVASCEFILRQADRYPIDKAFKDLQMLDSRCGHLSDHSRVLGGRSLAMVFWHSLSMAWSHIPHFQSDWMTASFQLFLDSVSDLRGLFDLKRGVPALFPPGYEEYTDTYIEIVPVDLFAAIMSFRWGWTITHQMVERQRDAWRTKRARLIEQSYSPRGSKKQKIEEV